MKKIIFLLSVALLTAGFSPALAATTVSKTAKHVVQTTKKTTAKKVVKKKKTVKKASAKKVASILDATFSPEAAAHVASATGAQPPLAYEEALQKAKADCAYDLKHEPKAQANADCDQMFLDAQTLLGQ